MGHREHRHVRHAAELRPLYGSSVRGDQLVLAVSRQLVKDAPTVEDDGRLDEAEVTALYQHYATHLDPAGRGRVEDAGDARYAGRHADAGPGGGPQGQDTDAAMTRSEERLNVGTESVPAGHEEVRLEREPVTDANRDAALSGADITEDEHEVQLNAERPVVTKETVPVERVRLATESVAGEERVSEEVRKEQIDEPEVDTRRGRER